MQPSQETKSSVAKSFYVKLLTVVGYLVPLVQSIPAWTGLMTLPFASYLILMFANLPVNLPRAHGFRGTFPCSGKSMCGYWLGSANRRN
jgi:hypothetical protein